MVLLVYLIAARTGLMLQFSGSQASPVWPPTGVAFAALLIIGYRAWPAIFLGALLANLFDSFLKSNVGYGGIYAFFQYVTSFDKSIWVCLLIALGNTGEALVGKYLVDALIKKDYFYRPDNVIKFLLIILLMCLVSSVIGVSALYGFSIIPQAIVSTVWFTWWTGDITGALIITPCLYLLFRHKASLQKSSLQNGVYNLFLLGLAVLTFTNFWEIYFLHAQAYLLVPFLIYAAIVYDIRVLTVTLIAICIIATVGTINEIGPFARSNQNESLILLQGFLAVISILIMVFFSMGNQNQSLVNELEDANKDLDEKVKKRTEELNILVSKLEASNKELDAFAYIASHDLKEPLRGITNIINNIMEDYEDILNEEMSEDFIEVKELIKRLETLIESLLKYSRVGRTDRVFQEVDLNFILDEVVKTLSPRFKELNVVLTKESDFPVIECDSVRIGEVFRNLISNAMKYNDKEEKEIKVGCEFEDENHVFYIKDNGIGIREKHFDNIFKMFKRLHGRNKYGGGTGAGMSIVKKIIDNHDGKIWVESDFGDGTTFYFTLKGDD